MSADLMVRTEVPVKSSREVRFDEALPPDSPTALPALATAVTTMERYISSHALTLFDRLVAERQGIIMLEGVLERLKSERDNLIGTAMDIKGETTVTWENFLVSRRKGSKPREQLVRSMLMTATDFCPHCGEEITVSPLQIQKATKVGNPGKPGITIKAVGEKEEASAIGELE